MAGILEELSLGLRQAAGVLNPTVQRDVFAADERKENLLLSAEERRKTLQSQFMMQQMSPQAQMARQQLENEQLFRREASLAEGDPAKIANAAMKYGKPELAVNIFNQQETRVSRAQDRKAALDAQIEIVRQRSEDKALDRAAKERADAILAALRQQSITQQGQIVQGNQQLQALRIEMIGDEKKRSEEKARLGKVQQLGGAFEKAGLPQMDSVLKAAEAAVVKDDVLEYINGPKSAYPDFTVGTEITNARQSVSRLFNITLKDRSGAAVTIPELERLKEEFGRGVFKKPAQLREAIRTARTIVENHYRGIAASYGNDALQLYNQNMKEIGGNPVLEGKTAGPDPLGIR